MSDLWKRKKKKKKYKKKMKNKKKDEKVEEKEEEIEDEKEEEEIEEKIEEEKVEEKEEEEIEEKKEEEKEEEIEEEIGEEINICKELENCVLCNKESISKQLCIKCNNKAEYYNLIEYQSYKTNKNYKKCIKEIEKPNNFYFNSQNKSFEPCKTCDFNGIKIG